MVRNNPKSSRNRARNNRGRDSVQAMLEMPGNKENPDSHSIQKQRKKIRRTRFLLKTTVYVITPLVGLTALMVGTKALEETPETSSLSVNDTAGKAQATTYIQNWLGNDPSPLPDGELVSWDGYETREFIPNSNQEIDNVSYDEEIHHFTVTDGDTMYDSRVVILVDPVRGVNPSGTPSLVPRTPTPEDLIAVTPWIGWKSGPTGDHIDGAVESWLEKFVSGSPKALKQVVDDGRADAAYMPLKNVRSVEFSVEGTGIPDLPDTRAEDATEVIARVELKIVWLKTPEVESAEEITTISYDLLIDRVDTSTPRVVSWGGTGEGPELTKFSVAKLGLKLDEPDKTREELIEEADKELAEAEAKKGDK